MDPALLALLALTGLAAGFVDAVAGGGGLIALPVLLSTGMPPVAALATNKLQGIVGTAVAAATYWRRGLVSLADIALPFLLSLAGAFLGAATVKQIDTSSLAVIVPGVLIVVALYFLFAPRLGDEPRPARLAFAVWAPVFGFALGFYDGIFGPGTGTFFTAAFALVFGLGLTRAAAHTKFCNVASNLGALLLFLPAGDVVIPAALAMIAGQLAGGWLGAVTGIRFGAQIIRPVVVVVSIGLAVRLIWPS
jgi:uncharacterized membrane protein YfcA